MINKLKKAVSIAVCTMVAFSVTAFGMTLETPSYLDGSVIIKGTGVPDKIVTLTAVKQGGSIRNKADFAAIADVVADENGNFEISFSVDDSLGGGVFVANVLQEGDTIKTVSFEHSSEQSRETAADLLKAAADSATVTNLIATTSQHYVPLKNIGIPCDAYNALSNKTDVADLFNANKTTTMSNEQLAKCFSKACGIGMLNSGADKEAALRIIDAEFEGIKWSAASEEVKGWIIASMTAQGAISTFADFDSKYAKANALYIINTARYTTIENYIDTYATVLGIATSEEYTKYNAITDNVTLNKVNQAIVTSLSSSKALTADTLLAIITNAVNSNQQTGITPGGSSAGGGSSGGGGGGGGGSVTSNYQVNNNPETPVKPVSPMFNDIDGYDWAKTQITVLAEKHIINGTGDNKYEPGRSVTREEFVKMIISSFMLGEQDGENKFVDMPDDHWAYGYVMSGVNNGLINGISPSEFGIGSAISRQDTAVIIDRVFKKLEITIDNEREYTGFADDNAIADYAKESITKLYCGNVLNGKGDNFEPNASLTRAEAAVLIYGAMNR